MCLMCFWNRLKKNMLIIVILMFSVVVYSVVLMFCDIWFGFDMFCIVSVLKVLMMLRMVLSRFSRGVVVMMVLRIYRCCCILLCLVM